MEKMLTPEQAAQRLNVPVETLRGWLRKGKLKGVKVGNLWRIPERDLKAITEPEGRLVVYTTWNRTAEAARNVGVDLPVLAKDVPARLVPLEAGGVRIPFWLEVELQTFTGRYEPCSEIDGEDTMLADWVPGLLEKYNREGVALPEDILQYLE